MSEVPRTRSVADARLFFEVMSEGFSGKPAGKTRKVPIIFSEDLGFAPVDSDVREAFRNAIELMREDGFNLVDDNPGLPSSAITWAVTASYDAAEHARGSAYNMDYLGEVAKGFIDFGDQFSAEDFAEAQASDRALDEICSQQINRCALHQGLAHRIALQANDAAGIAQIDGVLHDLNSVEPEV